MTEMTEKEKYTQFLAEENKRNEELNEKLAKAPVTYEWQTIVKHHIFVRVGVLCISSLLGLVFIYLGISKNSYGDILTGSILLFIFVAMARYLWLADKDVHYKLTPLGIIYTEKECIPEIAYSIIRGFAWFAVLLCLISVVFVGPMAFVGAGGMALLAFKFKGFRSVIRANTICFLGSYKIKNLTNAGVFNLISDKRNASGLIYFQASKYDEIIDKLSKYIDIAKITEVNSFRKLDF